MSKTVFNKVDYDLESSMNSIALGECHQVAIRDVCDD